MAVHVGGRGPGHLARVQGGFSLAAFMAQQSDGFWYDFTQTAGLFQTTDTSTPVTAFGDNIGRATDRRAAATATQSTTSFRPKYQSTGAAFDGADDNLLTGYTAGSGANFLVAKVVVPASVASNQIIAGARSTTDTRLFLSVVATGQVAGGVGLQGAGTIFGGPDLRGQTVVVGISLDGATVRLFQRDATAFEAAQVGSVSTTAPLRLGALNDNGTANSFFGGSIQHVLAGREFIDLARFIQIAQALGG